VARAEEPQFAPGTWVIVHGALRACPRWKDRVIDVAQVPEDGKVDLLQLMILDARGKTPSQLHSALAAEFTLRTSRVMPEIRIEHVPSIPEWDGFFWAMESLRAMIEDRCPGAVPGSHAPQDRWTPEELLRMRNRAWG
jgi:hypothetical protein